MKRVSFITASFPITVKSLKNKVENGEVTFENAVQRGLVWDEERKSYLIDSILQGYVVPPLYAKKGEDSTYDMLDGKQRSNAIIDFINGNFALTGMSDGMEEYEGMTFDQLDEEDKDAILDFNLTVQYFDGISDEEVRELFFRLNNGKPLTNFEQVKAKCKSLDTAHRIIAENDIFDEEKTEKKMSIDKKLELVFKAWAMLYMETPSLEKRILNPVMMEVTISDEQVEEMSNVFKRVYDAYKYIKDTSTEETAKQSEKVRKRIITPTHFLSILPFAKRSIEENRAVSSFAIWLKGFYNGSRRASSDDTYNDNASRGSAKADSIKKREECLARNYEVKFMN